MSESIVPSFEKSIDSATAEIGGFAKYLARLIDRPAYSEKAPWDAFLLEYSMAREDEEALRTMMGDLSLNAESAASLFITAERDLKEKYASGSMDSTRLD